MPRATSMSWEGAPAFRWVTMYKGVRYRVTCEELGAMVYTKDGSAKLANAWWEKKLAELNGVPARTEIVRRIFAGEDDLSRELREREAQAERRDGALRRVFSKASVSFVPALLDGFARKLSETGGPPVNDALREMNEKGIDDPSTHGLVALLLQALRDTRPALVASINAVPEADELPALSSTSSAEATERTIRAQADRWSRGRAEEAARGVRSADGADNTRIALSHFVRFAGATTDVDAINFDLWQRWYVHCRGEVARRDSDPERKAGWSADYAKKVFGVSRSFVRWLYESEVIASLPQIGRAHV